MAHAGRPTFPLMGLSRRDVLVAALLQEDLGLLGQGG